MKIEYVIEKIKPVKRKFNIGNLMVCSKCGNLLNSPASKCCGNMQAVKLREYVEQIRKEVFNESEWKFHTNDNIIDNN